MDLLMPLINAVADEVHSPSPAAVASPVPSPAGNTPAGKPAKTTSPRKKKNRSHQKRKAKKATKPAASEATVPEATVQESVPTVPVTVDPVPVPVEPPSVVPETANEQENRSPRKKRRQSAKNKNSKSNTPSTGKSPKNSLPVREPSSAPVSLPLAPNPNLINVRSPPRSLPTSPIARYASARGLASTRQSRNTASSASAASFVSSQLLPTRPRPRLVPSALYPQSAGQLNQAQNRRHNNAGGHGYYGQEGQRHFAPKPGTSNEFVSLEIADYYTRNRQSGEQFQQKQIIREIVEKQLRDKYPNQVISTYMIGSSWNGIGDNATCVDICILASKRNSVTPKTTVGAREMASLDDAAVQDSLEAMDFVVVGEETQEKKTVLSEAKMDVDHSPASSGTPSDDQDLTLTDVQTVLQAHPNYVSNLVHIPAKVPILKFTDRFSSLSVTLNLNQDASVRNSQLIRDYAKLDWRLPYLAFVIKQWARENRVCSAIEHTISPYSWTLMVLHYLQVGAQPPVLPSLQKLDPLRYGAGDAGSLFGRHRYLPKWTSANGANLRQLLKGFFRYYGYEFKASEEVISVREGARLDRASYQASLGPGREWKTACLCIEEPFTRANTTRSVNDPIKWENILNRFRLSSQALRGVRTSLWSILADDLYFPINYGK